MRKLYLRSCDICDKGMSLGYVWDDSFYICSEHCYQVALIDETLTQIDNENFLNAEDKLDWIQEVNHQIYVGWEPEEDFLGTLFTEDGEFVEEKDIDFKKDILVYCVEGTGDWLWELKEKQFQEIWY